MVRRALDRERPLVIEGDHRVRAGDHDSFAYGPAHGLPESKVGTFDWKRVFPFDP